VQDIVLDLLRRQRSAGFPDLSGANIDATIPIADRLINELIAETLPKERAVQNVQVQAEAGDRFKVRVTPSSGFLPAIAVTLTIAQQPQLPDRPILELRVSGIPKILMLSVGLTRVRAFLPPGVALDGERVLIDIAALLTHHGHSDLLRHLTSLNVTTREGAVIVAVHARVDGRATERSPAAT
jgi:hypothetical protein